jgi:hypothetical protein
MKSNRAKEATIMVKFVDVDPDEVNVREAHRGRVSYPILKAFLETGAAIKQLDRTGMQQGLMALSSSLGAYIRSHELPIRIMQRKGEIILVRTDLDEHGNPDPAHNNIKNIRRQPVPAGKYDGADDENEDISDAATIADDFAEEDEDTDDVDFEEAGIGRVEAE